MGIHPYGLFGTYESNTPFGKNYEIQHQLDVRTAQLNALSKKTNLSDDDIAKKEQLNKTVNMLSSKLNNNSSTTASAALATSANKAVTDNKTTFPEGSVISKNQNAGIYSPNQVVNKDSYLKGFFIDLKL